MPDIADVTIAGSPACVSPGIGPWPMGCRGLRGLVKQDGEVFLRAHLEKLPGLVTDNRKSACW